MPKPRGTTTHGPILATAAMLQPSALFLALALQAPAAPAQGGESVRAPEAVALLEAAAAATAELRNASYAAFSEVRNQGQTSVAAGRVAFARLPAGNPIGARLHVRGSSPGAGPGGGDVNFRVAYDGEIARGRFGEENVLWQAPIPGDGTEILQIAEPLLIRALHAPQPFEADLAAVKIELGEEVEVRGVKCRVVRLEHGAAGRFAKVEWSFSIEDHLPRKLVSERHRRGVFRTEIVEIAELQLNPMIHQALFSLPTPAGIERQDYVSQRSQGAELLAVGDPAPAFTLKDPSGKEHSLSDFAGKVLVLDFWATWCSPCRQAMPLVQEIHERFADEERVVVYGIATNEAPDAKPAEFMQQGGFTYELLLGGELISVDYMAAALPTFYVIGTDGTVLHASLGFRPTLDTEIIELIEQYLAAGG